MGSIMSHCNLAGSGADQTARSSFHSILLGRAIGFLTRLGQASVRFGMHVRAKLVSCKEYLLDLLKVCKNSAMARMSRKSACSTSSGVSTSATVELVNLTIGKATHPTNVLVSTCGSAATSKLASVGVAGLIKVNAFNLGNVENTVSANLRPITSANVEPTAITNVNGISRPSKQAFALVAVVTAVLVATGAVMQASPSVKAKVSTSAKAKFKTKAKTSAKVKVKTEPDSPGIAKNTSQAHLESTVMANVESLEVANVESLEVANVESPEVANVESPEVANVEAVAEPNVLLNVEPNVSEPVTLADVEAAGPAIAKSAELPSVDLTELTDEGVLSPSHVELTHSAAADAASLDHIAATDSVGGVAVETASPINTASDDSVDTDITDLADEGVAGSAHVELITSVNVEPASASNVEMVTPLKAETILASKNATKKAIKKTFDLVNVVSAVLAATGASVAKAKPPSSLAKIKKKIKSSTSTKTKAKTKSKTKSKTKAKTSAKVKDKTVSDSPGIAKNTSQAHLESTVMANVESLEVAGVETLKSTAMNESNMIVTEDHVATTTKLLDFADMENCSSRQMDQVEECIAIQQAGCGINDPEDFENASCNANMSLRDTADKKDLHSSAMDCVYLADHVSKTTQHLNPKRLLMGQLAEIAEMIARDPFVSNNGVIDAKKNGGIFTDYEDDTVGASKHNKSPSPLQDPMASQDLRNIVCEIESKEINEDEVELQSTKLCDWSSVDVDHSSNVQLKSFHKKAEDVLDVYKSQQSGAKVNVFKNRPSREEVATNSGVGHLVVASMKHVCTESFDGEMSNSASSVSSTTSSMIDNASQTEDSSTTGAIDLSADAVFGTEEAYEQTSVSTTKEDFVDVNAADQNVLEQSKVDSVESTLLEKFTLEPSSNQTPKTKSAYEDEEFARTYPCMNAFINEGPIGDWASCDDDVMWGQEAHGMHVEDARSAKQSITSPSSEAKKGYNISYFMPARGKKSSKKSSRKSSKKSSKKSSRTKVITTPQVQWEQRRTQSEANEDADTASSVETRASPISWDNLSRDTDENRNSLTNACAGSSDSTSWRRAKHTNSDIADQLKVESSMEGNKKSTFVYYPGTKAGSRRKVKK